jgi:hypothetical protein
VIAEVEANEPSELPEIPLVYASPSSPTFSVFGNASETDDAEQQVERESEPESEHEPEPEQEQGQEEKEAKAKSESEHAEHEAKPEAEAEPEAKAKPEENVGGKGADRDHDDHDDANTAWGGVSLSTAAPATLLTSLTALETRALPQVPPQVPPQSSLQGSLQDPPASSPPPPEEEKEEGESVLVEWTPAAGSAARRARATKRTQALLSMVGATPTEHPARARIPRDLAAGFCEQLVADGAAESAQVV